MLDLMCCTLHELLVHILQDHSFPIFSFTRALDYCVIPFTSFTKLSSRALAIELRASSVLVSVFVHDTTRHVVLSKQYC